MPFALIMLTVSLMMLIDVPFNCYSPLFRLLGSVLLVNHREVATPTAVTWALNGEICANCLITGSSVSILPPPLSGRVNGGADGDG